MLNKKADKMIENRWEQSIYTASEHRYKPSFPLKESRGTSYPAVSRHGGICSRLATAASPGTLALQSSDFFIFGANPAVRQTVQQMPIML